MIITIPIVFTNNYSTEEVSSDTLEISYEKADYGDLSKIKLLHNDTNEIEEINFDEYLYGVVSAEMPASYEFQALCAQAVVARTYTMYQLINGTKHELADICDNSSCCQAWISKENRFSRWEDSKKEEYWKKITDSVDITSGKYVAYNGLPINAFFHSNSGGQTELSEYVWGGNYPYLQSVLTSGEENYSGYNSEVIITKDDLIQKMIEKYSNFQIDFSKKDCIFIIDLTDSGRVKKMNIGNIQISGVDARKLFGLKSAKFDVKIIDNNICFEVTGYGHGVGLSQSGSDALAKQGYSYENIIKYFYKDVEIKDYSY